MPQMAPLSWMTLFLVFSLFIMATSNKIWFSTPTTTYEDKNYSKPSSSFISNSYSWKW